MAIFHGGFDTALADYPAGAYRSRQNGNWQEAATWERYDGVNWVTATTAPNATNSSGITIRNTHAVTINTLVTADEILVEAGGILTCNSTLNLADGEGEDLEVLGKMTLLGGKIQGPGSIVVGGIFYWAQGTLHTRDIQVLSGGRLHLYTTGMKALEKN
jgi:hypothetical protein